MSHALSLEVVGEGAETELQIAELTRLGCDLAQGFHFSRRFPPRSRRCSPAQRGLGPVQPLWYWKADVPGCIGETRAVLHSSTPSGIETCSVAVSFGGIICSP